MAVGVRITSNNLSGKTATVSFTPYTGSTSGTTVDLGSVTIPFNNITSHPYGDYEVYISDYDYTYTLNVPEPVADVQMFVYMNRMVDSDFYGAATLNFNDLTATIIDLGINVNDWNGNNIYELTNNGYMYYWRGVNDSNDRLVIFTDSTNTEIGRYSGTTTNVSRRTLNGKWVAFEDDDNGVLTYSNGTDVFTYTWNPITHNVNIDFNYDAVTSDGAFIINKQEIGNWTYNGNGESYLVNPLDGTTTLFKSWTDGTNISYKITPSSNFIVVQTQDQTSDSVFTNFEIYNTSGTLLETVSLTGQTYLSDYSDFHGTNKFTAIYHNWNDSNVDYKIISFNGDTEILIQTSHVKGTNYPNSSLIANNGFWPSNSGENKGGVVIMFYNNNGWANYGFETTYCDFVYMFNNQTSFSTYTFANNETKKINDNGMLSDVFRTSCDTGDGVASLLTIMSGSTHIESLNVNVADITNFNHNQIGNRSIAQIWTNGSNDVKYCLINASGVVIDTLNFILITSYASSMYTRGENAYFNIQSEGNVGYYVTSGSTTFTQTDYYTDVQTSATYTTDKLKSNMVLNTNGSLGFRVLNATGITQEYSFPEYNDFSINVGESKFMFTYSDSNDGGIVKVKLYDMNGTLLNSGTTSMVNGWDGSFGVKDRFFVVGYPNGNSEITLVSATNITSLTLQSYGSEQQINDYIWEND